MFAKVIIKPNRASLEKQNHDRPAQFEEPFVIALFDPCSRVVALLNGSDGERADFDHGNSAEMVGVQ